MMRHRFPVAILESTTTPKSRENFREEDRGRWRKYGTATDSRGDSDHSYTFHYSVDLNGC